MKILIVDDDPAVRLLVKAITEEDGHECQCASGGIEALRLFDAGKPDIVVLDIMMPKVDGLEVCRRIRESNQEVPVLFLSAKGDITDKRIGFSLGADDYLVKPFDEEELRMRMRALLRRAGLQQGKKEDLEFGGRFSIGEFVFDAIRHQVLRNEKEVVLTPKEFQIIYYLAQHQGEVVSKQELIESCWGLEYLGDSINLASYIRRLREHIEDDPGRPIYLKTVWGVGYVFEAKDNPLKM